MTSFLASASPGEVPQTLQAVGALITAVVPIALALITLFSPRRKKEEPSQERLDIEAKYNVDTSNYGDDLIQFLHKQNSSLELRIDAQDQRIDTQDKKIDALEEREDALLAHIEDLKSGAEQGKYPPWPRIPR